MNAQVKRKPTKTRLNAAVNPVAEAVQFVELQKAQVVIMKMDKAIEDLTMQRNEFDLAACIMSDMLTESDAECDRLRTQAAQLEIAERALLVKDQEIDALKSGAVPADVSKMIAQLECARADLAAAQAKIKRFGNSADYWRNLWVIADRNLYTAQKFIGLLIGVLGMLLVLWGAV